MSTEVILPQLGFSMSEGTISEWLVADGAEVAAGQPLYSIEAEKAVEEVEAPASGRLRIRAECGRPYPVGTVLAVIE